jgi:hypothetical protein
VSQHQAKKALNRMGREKERKREREKERKREREKERKREREKERKREREKERKREREKERKRDIQQKNTQYTNKKAALWYGKCSASTPTAVPPSVAATQQPIPDVSNKFQVLPKRSRRR